jgi:hypothetical protein
MNEAYPRVLLCGGAEYMFSVNGFYPPQSPLGKEGSPVLPRAKGELKGVSQGTLNTYEYPHLHKILNTPFDT